MVKYDEKLRKDNIEVQGVNLEYYGGELTLEKIKSLFEEFSNKEKESGHVLSGEPWIGIERYYDTTDIIIKARRFETNDEYELRQSDIAARKAMIANNKKKQNDTDRATYERLKKKFEKNT